MFPEGSLSSDFKQDSKSRFADAKPSYDHYSVTLAKLLNIFAPISFICNVGMTLIVLTSQGGCEEKMS